MPISGLVLTLTDNQKSNQELIEVLGKRSELHLGDLTEHWLPLVLDTEQTEESRRIHDWLRTLPGIDHVDVVYVHFDEPAPGNADWTLPTLPTTESRNCFAG